VNLFVLWSIAPILLAQSPPDSPPEESWLAVISLIASLVQGLIFLLGFTFSGLILIVQWLASLFSLVFGFIWAGLQGIVTALILPFVTTGLGILIPVIIVLVVVVILAA
jgi:hypothetical protein